MISLKEGKTLIEASAGTGKTYTLCRIALQLSLEKGISLDRILAVTFTEAATEELASRIRELYATCLHELETGDVKEETLKELTESNDFDQERAIQTLRYSLEVFDEAPISTIHGFCRRSLEQVALEARTPLDAELGQVEDRLIEQLRSEYIRQNLLEASEALSLAWPANRNDFERRLSHLGRQTAIHPNARLRPPSPTVDLNKLDRLLVELASSIDSLLSRKGEYGKHLKANLKPYRQVNDERSELYACRERGRLLPSDLPIIECFSAAKWTKALKKSGAHLELPRICATVDSLLEGISAGYLSLLLNYRTWLSHRLKEAKEKANTLSFNDLLQLLNRSLNGPQGDRLSEILARQYDAALLDEFQDTDPVQLSIVQRLFGSGSHFLFYIGDPKQAIYRFRGADIYAYFQATKDVTLNRIRLQRNYRSAPRLIEAVNQVFQCAQSGFADERIEFVSVAAGRDAKDFPDSGETPMVIRQFHLQADQRPHGSSDYAKFLADEAANDFAARLNGDPSLKASEVTFLVNTRREAETLSEALQRRGIEAAIKAERSVFQTQEADLLCQLLTSLASPTRQNLKRGTLALLHPEINATQLSRLDFDERAAPFCEYITAWSRDWFQRNFDVAFAHLIKIVEALGSKNVRLFSERRFTNLSQLIELLSEARDSENLSPRGLCNWLARKRDADVSQTEEWQARISSDEGKPQILTIHKSKGLQFPVVVLPFLGLRRVKKDTFACEYHDADGNLILDFSSEVDEGRADTARREQISEDIRLVYVALTRAEREVQAYLCPEEISAQSKAMCSSFARFFLGEDAEASTESLGTALEKLASESGGCIRFVSQPMIASTGLAVYLPDREARETVFAKELQHRHTLPRADRVLSFSALNRALRKADDASDWDQPEESGALSDEGDAESLEAFDEPRSEEISIFTLPKGTEIGDLLHKILESLDFSRPQSIVETTAAVFESEGFEWAEYRMIVEAQMRRIADIPLKSAFDTFSLRQTQNNQRVAELEFAYPATGDVKGGLIEALSRSDLGKIPGSWLESLSDESLPYSASMLRGFIDLAVEWNGRFYLFDWKSNYLGPNPDYYDENAIRDSMLEHNYYLQYLLYAVALKRFVAWRFPQEDFEGRFGGVFYIYARGISAGKTTGIYYDLPNLSLLQNLDEALGESSE